MPASKVVSPLILPLALALLAGCGSTASSAPTASSGFPLTIASAGTEVTIQQRPARIVSLSPTATEDLYAVGAGGQVVAVDSYSDYPKNAPRTSLSGFQPNLEAIAGYRPDLVIVADDSGGIVDQLAKLQVPALLEAPASGIDDVYLQLLEIGRATGHPAQASSTVAGLKRQIASAVRSLPATGRRLSVYHELDQTYYSATSHTFIGQVYQLLGLRNIADTAPGSNPYPQLSSEYVISADPDLIVLADTVCCQQSLATVKARPGWDSIAAVRRGAVLGVQDDVASQWGPRIALFIQAVAGELKALRQPGA
jgi:cobalamin transport system substrate-binding protein